MSATSTDTDTSCELFPKNALNNFIQGLEDRCIPGINIVFHGKDEVFFGTLRLLFTTFDVHMDNDSMKTFRQRMDDAVSIFFGSILLRHGLGQRESENAFVTINAARMQYTRCMVHIYGIKCEISSTDVAGVCRYTFSGYL